MESTDARPVDGGEEAHLTALQMDSNLDEMRNRTLRNNLSWLERFGCAIKKQHGLQRVRHAELPDHNALLVYTAPAHALRSVQAILATSHEDKELTNVYVDDRSISQLLRKLLAASAFKLAGATTTRSAIWSAEQPSDAGIVEEAVDIDRWSALYSRGFARKKEAAVADVRRWRKAASNRNGLRFWSIKGRTSVAAVCQTYKHAGVLGIFSLAMLTSTRTPGALLKIIRAVLTRADALAGSRVYYERATPQYRYVRAYKSPSIDRFTRIRSMLLYRRPTP